MPNRILKESINESRSLAAVSRFSQDLFKRLITYADDNGRFNADLDIMRARLYPLELDEISTSDLLEGLAELVGIEKIGFYRAKVHHGGELKAFGVFPRWNEHQRVRDSRAKCPDPEELMNEWAIQVYVPIGLKERVALRDRFSCQECGRDFSMPGLTPRQTLKCLEGALHFDPIVPVDQGGQASFENLRVLCASCNLTHRRKFTIEELATFAQSTPASCAPEQPAAIGGDSRRSAAEGNTPPQGAEGGSEPPPESESESESRSESEGESQKDKSSSPSGKAPRTPRPPRNSEEAKRLSACLKQALQQRGVTYFARDWHLKAAGVAQRMLSGGLSPPEIQDLMDWALRHPFWGSKITTMDKIADLVGEWQIAERGEPHGTQDPDLSNADGDAATESAYDQLSR